MINVLIVEDDPMVADLNKKYLQMVPGFRLVNQVTNGEEALHFLHDNPVALILLDVFMPKINGLQLLEHIRISYPKTDIIMVTAARNAQDIQTALRLGVIDYIVKPFIFGRFRTALLSYQARVRLLSSVNTLDQELLDNRIFAKQSSPQSKGKLKGIDGETLSVVKRAIDTHQDDFSINYLLPLINLSRISLKKYVDYLEESDELESYLIYLAVGRPLRIYSLKKHHLGNVLPISRYEVK